MAKREKDVRLEELRVNWNGGDRALLRLELDIPHNQAFWDVNTIDALGRAIYATVTGRQRSRFRRILEALR